MFKLISHPPHLLPLFCKKRCRICSSLCSYFYLFKVLVPSFLSASFLFCILIFFLLFPCSFSPIILTFEKYLFHSVCTFLWKMEGALTIPSALYITDQHFGDLHVLGEIFTRKALLSQPSHPRENVPNGQKDGGKRSSAGRSSVPAYWTI